MVNAEPLIEGIGFYIHSSTQEDVPTFDDLRNMVAETAYLRWCDSGRPACDGQEFWLAAERQLFGGSKLGGYRVQLCDLDDPRNKKRFRYWDAMIITPHGILTA